MSWSLLLRVIPHECASQLWTNLATDPVRPVLFPQNGVALHTALKISSSCISSHQFYEIFWCGSCFIVVYHERCVYPLYYSSHLCSCRSPKCHSKVEIFLNTHWHKEEQIYSKCSWCDLLNLRRDSRSLLYMLRLSLFRENDPLTRREVIECSRFFLPQI